MTLVTCVRIYLGAHSARRYLCPPVTVSVSFRFHSLGNAHSPPQLLGEEHEVEQLRLEEGLQANLTGSSQDNVHVESKAAVRTERRPFGNKEYNSFSYLLVNPTLVNFA